ncbi:MAG: RNA polymerase factor sigma-54 [Eubacteriales bacterium]
MKVGFELNMQQTQKLIMTTELRQAIQVLQYNNLELREYITKEMETNPFLEVAEKKKEEDKDENSKDEDIDWQEVVEKYDDISYKSYSKTTEQKQTFESYTSKKMSLKTHLLNQLGLTFSNDLEKKIGEQIIESLDKKGYLLTTVEDISKELECSPEEVEKVLNIIQNFDPVGIASRDLEECLKIQLKDKGIIDKNVYKVVDEHINNLACNRLQEISKDLDVDIPRVQEICDVIKMLEPKPSRGFVLETDSIRYITPDVTIKKVDGEYIILVNDSNVPSLHINSYYKKMLKKVKDKDTNKFLSDKFSSSMWLIKSIEQRRQTMYNVTESILKFQREFFDKGTKYLKPLVLKDVSEDIEVHESTVSRATNGKYVQTPRGLFELKYFFTSGVQKGEEGVSSTSIKSTIKDLIDNENRKKPLSDQKIANKLKDKNIKISRRTVAKYRDEIGIPSSSIRRRY